MLYDLAMFRNSCRKMKNHLRFHSKWWDSTASAKPCFRDTASSDALFRAPQHWPRANAKQEEWRQKYDNVSRKGRKNRKKQWFITHATCAVFVAFWFPWLQMTKPAHSPRIWSNYTVDAPEILHTHSWYNYNINYALIILRGSFALLHMLRAAICSLCFALSFHFCLPQFLSLSLSVTPSVCSKPPPKMPPPWLVKGNDSAADILTTTLQTLLSSVLAVEPCIVHISWLVMGRTTQIACCDESSDHVRYTVWSLNVGISGRDVIGCRLALPWNSDKNILSGRQFNYIL